MTGKHGRLAAALVMLAPAAANAQMRTASFEHWEPPRIAAESSDSVRVKVGYHGGKGALIGAAIGGGIGVVLGLVLGSQDGCADCGEQPSGLAYAAGGGLVGAGAGAVIGLLFGLSSPRYEWRESDGT